MKLKEYIDRFPEYDLQHFVKELGVSRVTLWKAIQGKKMDLSIAIKIKNGTSGIVRCEDLAGSDHEDDKPNNENNKQQQQNQAPSDAPV
jgi:hypothetical protein